MQPGEKQLGEMQHFNTTPLGEMQPGEMQFREIQLSHIYLSNYFYFYYFKLLNFKKFRVHILYYIFFKFKILLSLIKL